MPRTDLPTGKTAIGVALTATLAISGCGSGSGSVMPDVTGTKLDDATAAVENAGFGGDVDVDGGGVLGVVIKSNWTVCKQTPAAGTAIDDSPTLHVERQCAPKATPAGARSNTTPATTTTTTTETTSTAATPAAEPVLTPRTSRDLRAMLKVSDYCDAAVGRFAKKYEGQTIRFNGSTVTLAKHGDYKTRYDILVSPKSGGPADTGPALQFQDVSVNDLDLQGTDTIAEGDQYQFTATVGEYNATGCLLRLDPVTTEAG